MPFTFDFEDDHVLEWTATRSDATVQRIDRWSPTFYVQAHGDDADLHEIATLLDPDPRVEALRAEMWRPGFRHDLQELMAVDVDRVDAVTDVAHRVRAEGRPGAYRCFNVDLSPQFRYCLERGIDPEPDAELSTLELAVPERELVDGPITTVALEGERPDGTETSAELEGSPRDVVEGIGGALRRIDPDVLVLSTAELVPRLDETADAVGLDLHLGRRPGWTQLAGESTYESYGRVGHSPARYSVPGRAIVDRSNSFFHTESGMAGISDLVGRSWKPVQELAWASMGNVLTAMQIREAMSRDVLVPWNSWRHEFVKRMDQLHEADRGGHTFAPDVGVHEEVHELDFASLYPNIICQYNVSPDVIRCDCHDSDDVPGLGYSICDEQGYLESVLQPLIDDRAEIKQRIRECDDPERRAALEGQSSAIKWILVSCFGYQGFSNAKFGRIECHEAINAFAREILLDAKARLEAGGWRLVHGIVDSLWVTAREGEEQEDLHELATKISEAARIELEYESEFEWIAFVPMRTSDAGALTKYFGKRADPPDHEDEYKFRGVEVRQRSTPEFVSRAQEAMIEAYDAERTPKAVCAMLSARIERLERGDVEDEALLVKNRTSKPASEYDQYTRTVAALERASDAGLDTAPGQDVEYVVVDEDAESRDRVRLQHEEGEGYDVGFYRELLLRAAESVVSPVGWRRDEIEGYLDSRTDGSLAAYGD
ncbi:type B DNA-directed DNA polymerase [Salinarchaeum laminariae]|uniref:type B DNA-directed DNA polymerase n=1 Tax=Salinarchaeum laminariae TaxID=869888 RepID=UPI0020BD79D3|nr:type B DNA-directed DNA polymerase [Salinarchaeum laminariae]